MTLGWRGEGRLETGGVNSHVVGHVRLHSCRSVVRLVVRSLVQRELARAPSPLCRSVVRLVVRLLVQGELAKTPSRLCRSVVRLVVRSLVQR